MKKALIKFCQSQSHDFDVFEEVFMHAKTERNPKGAGCMRKKSLQEEQIIYQRHQAGVPSYSILNEFKISERTYIQILNRAYAAIQNANPPSS